MKNTRAEEREREREVDSGGGDGARVSCVCDLEGRERERENVTKTSGKNMMVKNGNLQKAAPERAPRRVLSILLVWDFYPTNQGHQHFLESKLFMSVLSTMSKTEKSTFTDHNFESSPNQSSHHCRTARGVSEDASPVATSDGSDSDSDSDSKTSTGHRKHSIECEQWTRHGNRDQEKEERIVVLVWVQCNHGSRCCC